METIDELTGRFPRAGRVEWIGVAPQRRTEITAVETVQARPDTGLDGDHHASSGGGTSQRQVTLIQSEHLPVVAALCGRESLDPARLRRNVVVSGINLASLKERRFRIGGALLQGTGPCAPCSLMERQLGPGGYNAMRGHGGITAVVLEGGAISVGDSVEFVADET